MNLLSYVVPVLGGEEKPAHCLPNCEFVGAVKQRR